MNSNNNNRGWEPIIPPSTSTGNPLDRKSVDPWQAGYHCARSNFYKENFRPGIKSFFDKKNNILFEQSYYEKFYTGYTACILRKLNAAKEAGAIQATKTPDIDANTEALKEYWSPSYTVHEIMAFKDGYAERSLGPTTTKITTATEEYKKNFSFPSYEDIKNEFNDAPSAAIRGKKNPSSYAYTAGYNLYNDHKDEILPPRKLMNEKIKNDKFLFKRFYEGYQIAKKTSWGNIINCGFQTAKDGDGIRTTPEDLCTMMPAGTLEEYRMFYFGFDAYKNNPNQPPKIPNDPAAVPAYDDFFKQSQITKKSFAYCLGIMDAKMGKIITRKASHSNETHSERLQGFNDYNDAQIKKATAASKTNTSGTTHPLITSPSNVNSNKQNNITQTNHKRLNENSDLNNTTTHKKRK